MEPESTKITSSRPLDKIIIAVFGTDAKHLLQKRPLDDYYIVAEESIKLKKTL